jgi:molybdopterin-guanine dinucleotide biosynthesis protein A
MLSLRHDCDAVVPVLVDPSSPLEGLSLSGAKDNWRGVRGEDTPSPRAERGSGGEVARPEPLHAAYSVRCLPHMERRLLADDLKISNFFSDIRLRELPESAVRALDPDLLSFFNINTQADVDRAQSLAIQGR